MKFEPIRNILLIQKGKKHEIVNEKSEASIRVLQIDDLRNDELIKYTNDVNGVLANKDDLMIAWDGANAGTIGYGKSGYIGSTIAVLRKKEPKKFDTVFLGKFLQSQFSYLRKNATGATIPHIDRKSLEDLKVPVLDIKDQVNVAKVIIKAESLIGKRKESIRLLDELLKSTFLEMFGDIITNNKKLKVHKIKQYLKHLTSGGRNWNQYYSESGARFIRSFDVQMNNISSDDIAFVNPPNNQEAERSKILPGDVLLTITGSRIGRAAYVSEKLGEAYVSQHVAIIRTSGISSVYLSFFLSMENSGQHLIRKFQYGQTKPGLNLSQIQSFDILVPPYDQQIQFAQIVEKIEAQKALYRQALQEFEKLYGSFCQMAFKGELKKLAKEAPMVEGVSWKE